jgi:hypothetical protein
VRTSVLSRSRKSCVRISDRLSNCATGLRTASGNTR